MAGLTPRPKLKDVARVAGVGTATVDRVLNERGNVSEEVRRKVIEAARVTRPSVASAGAGGALATYRGERIAMRYRELTEQAGKSRKSCSAAGRSD